MATWDITFPAGTSQGDGASGSSNISSGRPSDFDGATIDSVAVQSAPTVTADSNPTTDDGMSLRFQIRDISLGSEYGGVGSDAAALCVAVFPQSATSSVTIVDGSATSPAPTIAVALDWHEVFWSLVYNASMKNDGELFSWSSFTVQVTYTPIADRKSVV